MSRAADCLTTKELCARLGISRDRLHQQRAAGHFPDPDRVVEAPGKGAAGRSVAWSFRLLRSVGRGDLVPGSSRARWPLWRLDELVRGRAAGHFFGGGR